MFPLLRIANQIRIPENNDWVIFILLGCAFLYVFMMAGLLRDSTVKEFILQEYTDAGNGFIIWIIVGFVFCLTFSVMISQYIPIVPEPFAKIGLAGYQLNKFGFSLIAVLLFYLSKSLAGYLFFQFTGNGKRWPVFYFTGTRYFFAASLVLMALCIVHYFFPVDHHIIFPYYVAAVAAALIFKILYYLLHRSNILPEDWYYKFLYICTLQIVPAIALWNLLFF